MASSGSGGGDGPEERAAAAVDELIEARKDVDRIKSYLMQLGDHRAPWAEQMADGVLNRLSNAMSALDGAGAMAGDRGPAAGSDGGRPQPSASSSGSGNTRKRSFSRRLQRASDQRITTALEDGHIWRKYGQKEIQNSTHPRNYFRCTHKSSQGCNATRHVQRCEADTSKYVVTYYGEHTCRDPSTMPPLVLDAGPASADPDSGGPSNLISFETTSRTNAASTGASSQQMTMMDGNVTQLSTSWCTSDDVFSSSAGSFMQVDELGAVVGSAAAMSTRTAAPGSSALDNGGTMHWPSGGGTTGAGSFPSSPNSLGLEVGDDDFFRLYP